MYSIRLRELPQNSFAFVAREFSNRVRAHGSMMEYFYDRFDYTKNLKQKAVWDTLFDPELPIRTNYRIQHVCLRGAVGSGKSTLSIAIPIVLLHRHPGAKWLGMRRTEAQLMASLFTQVLEFCRDFRIPCESRLKSQSGPAEIRFPNGSKWVFWSSESAVETTDADNARGLGSTQYSGATLEEADMIHKEACDTVPERLREKSGILPRLIFYNLNPTKDTHWMAKLFQKKELNGKRVTNPEDYHDFHFTMHDNAYWHPPGYAESVIARHQNNPSRFRRFVLGEWGPEVKGTPIYGSHFTREFHIARSSFIRRWQKDRLWTDGPLCLCWDFGFHHPALIVFQDVKIGRFSQIRVLAGWLGDSTTLGVFGKWVLDEVAKLFPSAELFTYCDPAGKQKDPRGVSKLNALDILRSLGLNPVAIPSSESAGVELIIDLLSSTQVHPELGVQPEIIVEPPETGYTEDVIDMFEVGFAQEEKKGRDVFKPIDDGYYIHLADAFRYGIVHRRHLLDKTAPIGRDGYGSTIREVHPGIYLPEPEFVDEDLDTMAVYNFGMDYGVDRWR